MKTAEEVAKELAKRINDGYGSADDIAQALTAFREEGVEEAGATWGLGNIEGYHKGRAEALEECLRLAMQYGPTEGDVVKQIRALKVKP